MKNKGLFQNAIVEKFKALPADDQLDFVKFYAAQALPLLFEATQLCNDLEDLCVSDALCEFWDSFVVTEKYRAQLELRGRCEELKLKPQSSIPSYFLIKGLYFYNKHLQMPLENRGFDQLISRSFFMNALSNYSFQAFFDYVNELINFIDRAVSENNKIDLSKYLRVQNKIHTLGKHYGAAGYIVLANLYHSLFIYFADVEKKGKLFFDYLYDAYNATIHAEILAKYYLSDSFNALQGNPFNSLLRNPFPTIRSMKEYMKLTLCDNNANYERTANVKIIAIEHSNKLIQANYQVEYFTNESTLRND